MAQVLRNDDWWFSTVPQEVTVGDKNYPWYMAPFEYDGEQIGVPGDGFFDEERKLFILLKLNLGNHRSSYLQGHLWSEHFRLCKMSPAHFIHRHFLIRDKEGKLVPLDHWNPLQRRIYFEFIYAWKRGHIGVRMDVVKARQEGASTIAEAIISAVLFCSKDVTALLMSNKDANARRNYQMVERFYRNLGKTGLRERFIPQRQNYSGLKLILGNPRRTHQEKTKKTDKKVEYETGPILDSSLEVLTASTTASDVGFTATLVHLTELALWPNPEETWENLSPGIPDAEQTICIRESVAWMPEDWWHDQVRAAQKGESDFRLIFSGWAEHPYRWSSIRQQYVREYSRELPPSRQSDEGKLKFLSRLPQPLKGWAEEFQLSPEQCYWALRTWTTRCNKDWDKFCRQYPLSIALAFRSTGRGFFSRDAVEYYTTQCDPSLLENKPIWIGDLVADSEGFIQEHHDRQGYLRVWERPVPGRHYVGTGDGAEGQDPDGDFSVTDIICVETREQVAQLMIRLENVRYHAAQIRCLDRYYGNVFWITESTGSAGYALTEHLQPAGEFAVTNLYIREQALDINDPLTTRYGYYTGGKTAKFSLISRCRDEINLAPGNPLLRLHSYETARQLGGFVRRPDNSYGNSRKKVGWDDCVISLSLGVFGLTCEQRARIQGVSISGFNMQRMGNEGAIALNADNAPKKIPSPLNRYAAGYGLGRYGDRYVEPASLLDDGDDGVVHPELGICHA